MSTLRAALPLPITHFFATLGYIWRDSRVPLFAKIFAVLAPLYWLNPFDLIPDLQPGGYCDDVVIVCLLAIVAFRLVPKAVFRDSRQKALLKQKAAAFGMLYITLTGSIPCSAHQPYSSRDIAAHASATCVSPDSSTMPQARQHHEQHESSLSCQDSRSCTGDFFGVSSWLGSYPAEDSIAVIAIPTRHQVPISGHSPPILLTTRGGHYQLYASEDASAVSMAAESQRSKKMPPRFAGGFFIGVLDSAVPRGVGLC